MSETKIIKVLPIGTPVKIGGNITAVSIRGLESSISYECQWTTESLENCWVDEILIQPLEEVKTYRKIGFERNIDPKSKGLSNQIVKEHKINQ